MTAFVTRLILPFILVFAASLCVRGYADIGDGFSAGAIGALGAVAHLTSSRHGDSSARLSRGPMGLIVLGLFAVLAVVWVGPMLGHPPVTHAPPAGADVMKIGAWEMHTSLLFDLGVAMVVYGALVAVFDRIFPDFGDPR